MAEKIDFFEGVKSHFDSLETKIIEVEEWGLIGDKAIYTKPFNMLEKSKIFKGANDSDLNVLIDVIIEKSLTKDGDKMFTLEHKLKFKVKADTDVISRVATEILTTDDVETLKKKIKNSSELYSIFALAQRLHKTASEILQMSVQEFNMWIAYFQIQKEDEDRQNRINQMKR